MILSCVGGWAPGQARAVGSVPQLLPRPGEGLVKVSQRPMIGETRVGTTPRYRTATLDHRPMPPRLRLGRPTSPDRGVSRYLRPKATAAGASSSPEVRGRSEPGSSTTCFDSSRRSCGSSVGTRPSSSTSASATATRRDVRFLIGDIRDRDRLIRAMEGIDVVFHCAALKHVESGEYNPFEATQTNVVGTQNVIDACLAAGRRGR